MRKGPSDIISNGLITHVCNEPGSARRCGGQGDLLSGAIATFNHWFHKSFDSDTNAVSIQSKYTPTILACLAASMMTRRCSRLAFQKHLRSTTTSDMIKEIKNSFASLFPIDHLK
ncbi:hypothetical protein SSS_09162 [Sarcoptes scabiei]|nr:hypothetical protein SSS_09162 [Sarcoptes scabiei]